MLLERADALDGLRAALVRVRDDSSGEVCTVSGEAGVGKSTLLRAFTGAVTEPVWEVVPGLVELEVAVPRLTPALR